MTPLLLEKLADLRADWVPIELAEFVVVGSVLDLIPSNNWSGTVLGAGLLHEEGHPNLLRANVLAIRGKLTARRVKARNHNFALGDPGLLCSEIIPEPEKKYDLTVVPHWSDYDLANRFAHLNPHVIDPETDTAAVVSDIAASRKIVASSLHGIVVADSYRIPRRAEQFAGINSSYEGGEFKYHDYASVLNEKMKWGVLHTPKERFVEKAQAELFDAFRSIASKKPKKR